MRPSCRFSWIPRTWRAVAVLGALVLLGAGSANAQEQNDPGEEEPRSHAVPPAGKRPIVPPPAAPLVAKGREIFRARCVRCHGETGDGRGPQASRLDPPPRDLRQGHYKLRSTGAGLLPTDADLERTIRRGIPGTAMQPVPLHENDLKAVVAFVKTLHLPGRYSRFRLEKQPEPLPVPKAPRLTWKRAERGRQVFMIYRCWRCHGPEGKGDGPVSRRLRDRIGKYTLPADLTSRPFKSGATPRDLFRLLVTGMDYTPMPSWSVDRLGILPVWPDSEYRSLSAGVIAEFRAYMKKEPKVSAGFRDTPRRMKLGTERMWDLIAYIYSLRPRDHHRLAGPRPARRR